MNFIKLSTLTITLINLLGILSNPINNKNNKIKIHKKYVKY